MLMKNVLNRTGYYFDLNTTTLHITKAYEKKSLCYGSDACRLVLDYQRRFPEMTIEVHKRKPSSNRPLPYKMMLAYIAIMPNAASMEKEFERVQKMSVAYKSPYKFVETWFKANYPHYEKFVEKDETGNPTWKVAEVMAEAKEQAETLALLEQRTANEDNEDERGNADVTAALKEAA